MANKMLIDATHPEETRVVVLRGNRVEEFDFESAQRKQLRGNIYLAKVTRVEPSLQAAFVDYGGNRHGFLAFSEIHPDYYQIPVADRQALIDEDERAQRDADAEVDHRDGRRGRSRGRGAERHAAAVRSEPIAAADAEFTEHEGGQPVAEPAPTEPAQPDIAEQTPTPTDMAAPAADATPETISAELTDAPLPPSTTSEDAEQTATSIAVVPSSGPGGNGLEAVEEEEIVESVGGADAMEEVPERMPRMRRQYKIQEVIKRRQVMLVQVVKEERGTKGAALTTYLSLAGRYSVLMPNTARGGGISRKITNSGDRGRLKEIAQELEVPEGMGVILRTAGASRTKTEIKRDFEYLLRVWETVRDLTLKSTAPTLVYEEGSLVKRSIRDLYNKDIDEIVVAGDEAYKDAKEFMRMLMPSHAKNVKPYKDSQPILTRYGIESQLDAMFSPVVQLRSGGYIVLNQAEALVAIDVNSGRATREHHIEDTALKTNCEAAEEVARQLRLRDLAGLIVIDFIDMDEKRNNRTVERRLKESLKHDRARIQVGRISHFGLLEMSRQRIRTSVLESSTEKCPQCGGSGHVRSVSSVALQLLRSIEEMLLKGATHNLIVRTRSEVALYVLNHKRAHLRELEQRFQVLLTITADPTVTGQQSFVIDRGEQVHTVEQAKALAAQSTTVVPFVEEEDEDEIIEDDETAAEGELGEAGEIDVSGVPEGQPAEPIEGQRQGRGRRRRRRGRRGAGEGREPESFTHETVAEHAVAHAADDAIEPAGAEGQALEPQGHPVEGGAESRAEGERRRRRRGRRGGRRNRRDREGGDAALMPNNQPYPHEQQEPEHDAPQTFAPPADFAPAPRAPEPSPPQAFESRAAEPAPPEPGPAPMTEPRRRSTVREPAPHFGEPSQPAPTPVRPPEPMSPPQAEQEDANRPRRTGWWSRR